MGETDIAFKEIDSIKGFEYPVACTSVCIAPNQRRILTLGIYKPAIKVFDLNCMSLKFERHIVTDALKVASLTDDGEKFCVLRTDRSLEFHTRNGLHEVIKMPNQPKEILFDPFVNEVYASGDFSTIYRFNLEQGRFLHDIEVAGIRSLAVSAKHGLVCGVSADLVHFIDPATRTGISTKHADDSELLSIDFSPNGLNYAVGSATSVAEFDIRAEGPIYRIPTDDYVKKVKFANKSVFYSANNTLYSTANGGSSLIELDYRINDFDINQGLLIIGGEYEEIKCFFTPALGVVPNWCTSVDFE